MYLIAPAGVGSCWSRAIPFINCCVGEKSRLVSKILLNLGSYIAVRPNPTIGLSTTHEILKPYVDSSTPILKFSWNQVSNPKLLISDNWSFIINTLLEFISTKKYPYLVVNAAHWDCVPPNPPSVWTISFGSCANISPLPTKASLPSPILIVCLPWAANKLSSMWKYNKLLKLDNFHKSPLFLGKSLNWLAKKTL